MNTETGEIRFFEESEQIPENFVRISKREAGVLSRTAEKQRSAQLKQMRKTAIRRAKKLIQGRLSQQEIKEVFEMV